MSHPSRIPLKFAIKRCQEKFSLAIRFCIVYDDKDYLNKCQIYYKQEMRTCFRDLRRI